MTLLTVSCVPPAQCHLMKRTFSDSFTKFLACAYADFTLASGCRAPRRAISSALSQSRFDDL